MQVKGAAEVRWRRMSALMHPSIGDDGFHEVLRAAEQACIGVRVR